MKITAFAKSSVGKKILMALTGLAWFLFVIAHLLGNLTLLSGQDAFNDYSHFLTHLFHGWFVILADLGLLFFLLIHTWSGLMVYLDKLRGREVGYKVTASAGGPSRKSIASTTMIFTGPVLLIFIILHVMQFKYGPGMADGYVSILDGHRVRDLYRVVVEAFQNLWIVAGYIFVMLMLGFHLAHGVWSGLQSLGATHPKWIPALTRLSVVCGIVLAFGFLYIPLHVYFFVHLPKVVLAGASLQFAQGVVL